MGVSLYTWTSVIGVVLAGVTIGNYLGGRLADLRPTRSMLALIYVAGPPPRSRYSPPCTSRTRSSSSGAPALVQVVWITAVMFLLPSTILGAPTPLLTRLSLDAVEHAGRVVGRIQAAAALGSIAGTFLTGFVLISWIGTRHIVAGIAAILLVLAILARPPWLRDRVVALGSLAVVIVAAGAVSHSPCVRESDYYCIDVTHGTQDGRAYEGYSRPPPERGRRRESPCEARLPLRAFLRF